MSRLLQGSFDLILNYHAATVHGETALVQRYLWGGGRASPEFQVYNTALISAQLKETYEEMSKLPRKWGRAVESAMGAHLISHSLIEPFNLSYWRHGNHEVDFVMEMNGRIVGLEIKSGTEQNVSGLEVFKKHYPSCKTYHIGKVGLPWKEFLSMNPIDLF